MLKAIQKQSERLVRELNWNEKQIQDFIDSVNDAFKRKCSGENDEAVDNSLVYHSASYSGGFILFGGWTKIYDKCVPSGQRGHELYLAFGGFGAGGWSGDCDIELITEGTFMHEGKTYNIPSNHYGNNDWDGYRTAFSWFYNNVESFMLIYFPQFFQPIPVFCYFDKHSNRIGISVPNRSISCGIGGGTVQVKS
jgi:hypothetical protein